jgi:hypothetical protein
MLQKRKPMLIVVSSSSKLKCERTKAQNGRDSLGFTFFILFSTHPYHPLTFSLFAFACHFRPCIYPPYFDFAAQKSMLALKQQMKGVKGFKRRL